MEDITIESLIAQKRVVTAADLLNPINDYMVVGVYQTGTNKSKGDGTSYKNYAISIAELLGGGSVYTASNGITLVGNDFQFTTQNISQFVNNVDYLTSATIGNFGWVLDGNTVGSEKFLGTVDNFALPFRTNNVEVARFNVAGNLGIGTPTPTARLQIKGVNDLSSNLALRVGGLVNDNLFTIDNAGFVAVNTTINTVYRFLIAGSGAEDLLTLSGTGTTGRLLFLTGGFSEYIVINSQVAGYAYIKYTNASTTTTGFIMGITNAAEAYLIQYEARDLFFATSAVTRLVINGNGNIGINIPIATARLHIVGPTATAGDYALKVDNILTNPLLSVRNDGLISMPLLQTGNVGLASGDLYVDSAANILANGDLIVGRKV